MVLSNSVHERGAISVPMVLSNSVHERGAISDLWYYLTVCMREEQSVTYGII